ncbi:putative ATP-dependent RNA helicase DHX57 [Physella acuta]|uniref:putative ATP-dependent RNA helicase DHX57 n=1 Tax=Physella acuta TaxID=109671 RepID=UPI0027DDB348|nr:putative ATP-dependent RNA helicase DHX57 [Physella acuta]
MAEGLDPENIFMLLQEKLGIGVTSAFDANIKSFKMDSEMQEIVRNTLESLETKNLSNGSPGDSGEGCLEAVEEESTNIASLKIANSIKYSYHCDPEEMLDMNQIIKLGHEVKKITPEYSRMQAIRKNLPTWNHRNQILDFIAENQVVIISGLTGCGKSTQVPQYILEEALQEEEFAANIVCTQPRRISAMSVAKRVAEEMAEPLGGLVGYQIRLESNTSNQTRLLFCTIGILLRRLEGDPTLEHVSHVIIDEVHERSSESDFLLMIVRDILKVCKNLKVILMSATMNTSLFSEYFGVCPIYDIPGRLFEVEQFFLEDVIDQTSYVMEMDSHYARPRSETRHFHDLDRQLHTSSGRSDEAKPTLPDAKLSPQQLKARYSGLKTSSLKTLAAMECEKINYELIVHLIEWIVKQDRQVPVKGAILVFLPGYQEIQTLYDLIFECKEFSRNSLNFKIIPLHSSLSSEEQYSVFLKPEEGVTKIVLSTNIAETSITIDDIVYVIDTGRMKEMRFDQVKSMESLDMVWTSRTNTLQRMGRAGRVQAGKCFHLFTSYRYRYHLLEQPVPEIQRTCLEQLVLRTKVMTLFKNQDIQKVLLGLIEPPPPEAVVGAVKRLTDLGALDSNQELTPLGYHVGSLPVDVRIGKLMLFGAIFKCLDSTLTMAATLSFKSPFISPFNCKKEATDKKKEFSTSFSDHLTMLKAYEEWYKARAVSSHKASTFCKDNFLSHRTLQMLTSLKHQYVELLSNIGFIRPGIRQRDVLMLSNKASDGVKLVTGEEANVNSDNTALLSAMLVAALYPNVIEIITPLIRSYRGSRYQFKTKDHELVNIHPSSVNHKQITFPGHYLVYHEKVKTSKVYLRDCTVVSQNSLLLFAGGGITIKNSYGRILVYVDDLIRFQTADRKGAELIRDLRTALDHLLSQKISQPDLDLQTYPNGKKVIDCIVNLITDHHFEYD